MSENRDPASAADAEMEATALAGLEAGIVTLTPDDLRAIRNVVVAAITHYPDVGLFLSALIRAVLAGEGVLTVAALMPDTGSEPVRKQLENVAFAAIKEAVRLGIVAAGPNPRGN